MKQKFSDEQLAQVRAIVEAERQWALGSMASSDLSDQRIRNFEYYLGEMLDMPAPDGTSQAVSTDVQDAVEGALPIILDVLTSTDKLCVFRPRSQADTAAAQQETDYVNHVFYEKNPGFLILHNAIKDALMQKNGYIKWWMETEEVREREDYQGLTEDAFALLADDKDVVVRDIEQIEDETGQKTFNVTVEKKRKVKSPRILAVPPEEILVSKNARDRIQESPYWAHIQRKPQADVIAMFPEKADIIKAAAEAGVAPDNFEAVNRQTVEDEQDVTQTNTAAVNKGMRMLELSEHFIRMVLDEDAISRHYKVTSVGTTTNILDIEEVPAWFISSGTGIIMPHRHFGRALADLAIDIQQIKTSLLRSTLNNAYFANNQRMEVAETHASENTLDDLLNNRVGGIVRTKMPGGLNVIESQSIGNWTLPIVEYMDKVRGTRIGVSENNTGLDIDSMNHARPGAVNRIMDAAEMRLKLMARVFAETLITDTFRGLHGMLQQYSEAAEEVELRGQWVTVDPREWQKRDHLKVTLPLGGISKQMMLQFFAQSLGIQEKIAQQQGGMNGPLVSYQNVYSVLDKMFKIAGEHGANPYFMTPPPPNPNAPPPPDPRMVEAQAKAQATQQQTQAGIQADQAKAQSDAAIDAQKQQAQRQHDQLEFAHKAALDKLKFEHETQMESIRVGAKLNLEAQQAKHKMQLEREKAELQAELDRKQAALQAKPGVGEV